MLLLAVGVFALYQRERFESHSLQAQLEALAPQQARARQLQLEIITAEAKLNQLAALEKRLPKPDWSRLLMRITQSMPDDVWLDHLAFLDAQTATVTGASYADSGVYDFVNYLKQVPDISEISLAGTGSGRSSTGPATSFDVQLSLASTIESSDQENRHD
jgi:Tfp pilus assembly protein PilN